MPENGHPIPPGPDRQPWDQISSEGDRAYSAFLCYKALPIGDRTLDAAWRDYQKAGHAQGGKHEGNGNGDHGPPADPRKAPGYFRGWAAKWFWKERVAAWDRHQAKIVETARQKAVEKVAFDWALKKEQGRTLIFQMAVAAFSKSQEMMGCEALRLPASPPAGSPKAAARAYRTTVHQNAALLQRLMYTNLRAAALLRDALLKWDDPMPGELGTGDVPDPTDPTGHEALAAEIREFLAMKHLPKDGGARPPAD